MSFGPLLMAMLAAGAGATTTPFAIDQRSVILTVHATGAQIYECKAEGTATPAWALREPIATLIKEGKSIGRHYAGPTWALDDGSVVTGKLAASLPGPSDADIPQLKLTVVGHSGHGLLDQATTVYRIYTEGGKLAGSCDIPGDLKAIPYGAYYEFAK